MAQNFVQAIPMSIFNAATLDPITKQPINSSGLPNACFLIRIVNDSDRDIFISYDGIADHDFLRTGESLQLPFESNSSPNNYVANLRAGTKVYLSGVAGGSGSIYLIGYFQN